MKKLITGYPAALNFYWSSLEKENQAVWLVKNRSQRRLIELQKPGMEVIDLPGWCLTILSASGLAKFKLMDNWQQLAMLRLTLADDRCKSMAGLQQVVEFPGSQKKLLAKIQRMTWAQFLPEFQENNADADRLSNVRQVYEQLQMESNLCDEHLILTKFIEFQEDPLLQELIKKWANSLKTSDGGYKPLVIPRGDDFTGIEQSIILFLSDFVDHLQLGIESQKHGENEKYLKTYEIWSAVSRDFEAVIPADAEEMCKASHFRFDNITTEKSAVATIVRGMQESHSVASRVVVYVPGERQAAEQISSALRQAGIVYVGPRAALIEKPEVRILLDIAAGFRDNWPAVQLVDLLRNPSFQFDAFHSELNRRVIDQLAGEIYCLGEVHDISQIRESLNINWDEAKRFRFVAPSDKYQLQSMHLLSKLGNLDLAPDEIRVWPDWVSWLKNFIITLLGVDFKDRLNDLWHVLDDYSEMELAIGQVQWFYKDFLEEIQLILEQAEIQTVPDNAANVVLYQGDLPVFSVVGSWVCCGMNEKHYPSRVRLREGLRNGSALNAIWENEQNEFAGLCGLAFSRLIFTSSKMNFNGDELNPSGLLDTIERGVWKSGEWQNDQITKKSLSSDASRFFSRGVTLFNNRKNRDSRYLGLVSSQFSTRQLQEYFNSDYGFSSTSLESAALCQFQFFAGEVLGIDKIEVNDDLDTNYLMEGNVIHAILEDIHTCRPSIDEAFLFEIRQLLSEKLDEYLQPSGRVKNSNSALARWQIQRRRIELKLSGYPEQVANQYQKDQEIYGQETRVIGVELKTRGGNIRIDPLVLLDDKTGLETRVHGRIDRVDQLTDGEQVNIRIIDYKSGSRITSAEIEGRLHLQLPLYAMMLNGFKLKDAAKGIEAELRVADLGFWYLKKTIGGYKTMLDNQFNMEKMSDEYKEIVLDLVRIIRKGEFKINPKVPKCEEKCSLHEMCRIREIRMHPEMKL